MDYKAIYQSKLGTLEGALELIKSGDTIATPIYGNEPTQFLKRLHTIALRVENVTLWTMLMMGEYPVMTDNSLKGSIDIFTFFYNNDCRKGHDTGCFQLVPLNLHAVGRTVVATRRPSVFVAAVSPMDAHGNVYLSFDVQATRECLEAADTVVFEINKYVPRVFGDTTISIEKADYIYEADIPLPYAPATPSSEVEKQIAQHVVSLIHDGDCIQLGIGGMPNAVGEALMDNRKLPFGYQMVQRQRKSRAAPSSKTPAQKELRRLCGGNPPPST